VRAGVARAAIVGAINHILCGAFSRSVMIGNHAIIAGVTRSVVFQSSPNATTTSGDGDFGSSATLNR
jgi:hypothetical protein